MIAPTWPFRRPSRDRITLEIGRHGASLTYLNYHSIRQLGFGGLYLPKRLPLLVAAARAGIGSSAVPSLRWAVRAAGIGAGKGRRAVGIGGSTGQM